MKAPTIMTSKMNKTKIIAGPIALEPQPLFMFLSSFICLFINIVWLKYSLCEYSNLFFNIFTVIINNV